LTWMSPRGFEAMGRIVTLGEVVADVYRERAPSEAELPFTARPGGAPERGGRRREARGGGLLGHSSIQTTGDVYADWDLEQLAATMERVLMEDDK
jgi:hypothetical protein